MEESCINNLFAKYFILHSNTLDNSNGLINRLKKTYYA